MEFALANGITQFAEGEPKRLKCAKQNDAAKNLPRMDSALGVLLDGTPSSWRPRQAPSKGRFRLTQCVFHTSNKAFRGFHPRLETLNRYAVLVDAKVSVFKTSRTSSASPRLRVRFAKALRYPRAYCGLLKLLSANGLVTPGIAML